MELLKQLCTFSPSGREQGVAEFIRGQLKNCCDEISTDVMGNLIAHKKGNGPKLMLTAHMDEIGFIITYIEEKGFLRFAPVGGHEAASIINQQVQFANGVMGVIHYDEKTKLNELKMKDCYIDIGVKDRAAAEKLVSVGDMAAFRREMQQCGDVMIGRALDNKAGCYVLIQAMQQLKDSKYDVYGVFTVQEEVGLRGARTSAFAIQPDIALALDVTDTGDVPGCDPMAVELGGGAAIKLKDGGIITHPLVKRWLMDTAKAKNIPYQLEILRAGSTDVGAISLSRGGVMCGGISIPTRYIHTPNEMAAVADIKHCVALLVAAMQTEFPAQGTKAP